jgi:choline dehydrogenase
MNVRGVRRCSTAAGFLRRAQRRTNFRLVTGAQASRIELRGGCAHAVHFRRGDREEIAVAGREILVAAGAVASPQLLILSGIGPAAQVRGLGIDVAADRTRVGRGLQDHLNIRTSYRCSRPITMNDRLGTAAGRLLSGAEYLLLGKGPLTVAAGYAGAFYRGVASETRPDMQAILLLFSTDRMGTRLLPNSGFMVSAYQLRPASRGAISLASPDPRAAPLIDPAYLAEEEDRQVTLRGIKRLQAIMASPALRPFLADTGEPPLGASDEVLMAHIRSRGSAGHHLVGSCGMGLDPDAVVDPRLRVNEVGRLRVVDGSIMPSITSGNTLAPIVMIAEKGAAMILEDANAKETR